MKNYTLHIPEGVKDYTGAEEELKEKIQNRMKQVFHSYSYDLIETPTFEYLDVFTIGEASFQKPSLYNLVSRQGELMALRSDMTRAIARVVCSQKSITPMPQRYAYIANSFRYPERYQGKLHEFTQAGVELIGKNSVEADAEIIKVAIEALKVAGIGEFSLHIGSSQFLEYTLSDLGLAEEEKQEVYAAIEKKDVVKLKTALQSAQIEVDTLEMILELTQCAGKIALLRSVKGKVACPRSQKALEDLEHIYEILEDYGISDYILFDFSILSYGKYYTGMMFEGYTHGIGSAIVEGGRYDNLLYKFGHNLPAVGFGIHVNLIMQRMIQKKALDETKEHRTLVVFNEATRRAALQISDQLREQGLVIENSFFDTIEEAVRYGETERMGGILHFKQGTLVDVYNLQAHTVEETTIDAL